MNDYLLNAISDLVKAIVNLSDRVENMKTLALPQNNSGQTEASLRDWLDNQDVMQTLRISPRTLQTLRTNGTLPFSRIGNKLYYRKQDILKILNDNYTMYKIKSKEDKKGKM